MKNLGLGLIAAAFILTGTFLLKKKTPTSAQAPAVTAETPTTLSPNNKLVNNSFMTPAIPSPKIADAAVKSAPVPKTILSAPLQSLLQTLVSNDLHAETPAVPELSRADLRELAAFTKDPEQKGELRQAAVYALTKQGLAARTALTEVAAATVPVFENSQDPHAAGSYRLSQEVSLRITALEALDKMATQDRRTQKNIETVLNTQTNPTLKFLTQISLDGIQNHKPGKLTRAIDAMLSEVR